MDESVELMTEADARDWADGVIRAWKSEISTLGIGNTGNLANSLHYSISAAAATGTFRVDFKFYAYGRFVDMGVGRGMPKGSIKGETVASNRDKLLKYRNVKGQIIDMKRQPKPWYTQTIDRKVAQLKFLFAAVMREHTMKSLRIIGDNGQ